MPWNYNLYCPENFKMLRHCYKIYMFRCAAALDLCSQLIGYKGFGCSAAFSGATGIHFIIKRTTMNYNKKSSMELIPFQSNKRNFRSHPHATGKTNKSKPTVNIEKLISFTVQSIPFIIFC